MIGCRCSVCESDRPRNRRLRTGAHLQTPEASLLIDTPTDLRQQALRHEIDRVDAILFTHAHADHIFGLDDVRPYNFRQGGTIPCYGSRETLAAVRRYFSYVFEGPDGGGGRPRLELIEVEGPFVVAGVEVVPVSVLHGDTGVLGYRVGGFAYVTDCNRIPAEARRALAGVEVLVLDALRFRPHPTHFTVAEAIAAAAAIGARRTVLTHLSHEVDYYSPEVRLPEGVELAYDGLVLPLS